MKKFDSVLIITHVDYRKSPPFDPIEGPYSSVAQVFQKDSYRVKTLQLPLYSFDNPLLYGQWQKENKIGIPPFLGKITVFKYIIDIFLLMAFLFYYNLGKLQKRKLIIGIDPLSCLTLVFFKKIFNYKLIFYSVEFNKKRFTSKFLQFIYEKADELCSRFSDQVWVTSEAIKMYKEKYYGLKTYHIPNSNIYTDIFYNKGKTVRSGDKLAWTGRWATERQFKTLIKIIAKVQKIKPAVKLYFAPVNNNQKFVNFCKEYNLKNYHVFRITSRYDWLNLASICDFGLAIYDNQFGQTPYTEPLKMWDFLLVGIPFIISCEPAIPRLIKRSDVAYILKPDNIIPDDNSLKKFLRRINLKKVSGTCLKIAAQFAIDKKIKQALKLL